MMNPKMVASLFGDPVSQTTAFHTPFSIRPMELQSECVVNSNLGANSGCHVSRMSVSVHTSLPHLETAAHVLGTTRFPWSFSTILPHGSFEHALLVTPHIITLGESDDTYPAGCSSDNVICMRELEQAVSALTNAICFDSVIVRIPHTHLPLRHDSREITDWPYLTVEAAQYIQSKFSHYRTNAPSVEKCYSQGGMWSHCIIFGIDPETRTVPEEPSRRTIGELFQIPTHVPDGTYTLICPYVDVGDDCAMTSPLLFNRDDSG
jgi:hypothetical protein